MALITAAQFREHYPLVTGTAEDTRFATLVTRADSLLALYCGYPAPDAGSRTLEVATYTVYLDGPTLADARAIDVGLRPLVAVTTVHVDTEWDYGADSLVDSGEYVADLRGGVIRLRPSSAETWTEASRAIRAVVTAGYATTPPDLVLLVAATVRHLLDMSRVQGVQQQQYGAGDSATYSDATTLIPAAVKAMLGPYILWESRVG